MTTSSGGFLPESERDYKDRTKEIEGLHSEEKSYLPPRMQANRVIKNEQKDALTKWSF